MSKPPPLPPDAVLTEARSEDAPAIAAIHLSARQRAMPDLQPAHTEAETRAYFAKVVGDRPRAWWVVRQRGHVAAYLRIDGEALDQLYVAPGSQGQGFGSALLAQAKTLSPHRLELWTSAQRAGARLLRSARLSRHPANRRGQRGRRAGRAIRMAARAMTAAPRAIPGRAHG